MKPFDGRIGKRLSHKIVGDIRFFAFYIGNETILSTTNWGIEYSIDIIFEPSKALGDIFALKLFSGYGIYGNRQDNTKKLSLLGASSSDLIGQYIQSLNDNNKFSISFNKFQSQNENNWRDVIVLFFRDLGSRSLQTAPLSNYKDEDKNDYAYWIISDGSFLERTTAIFCNILRMDKEFNVINEEWARYRTSQYICMVNDETNTYEATPPFKEWEMELWM